MSDYLEPQEAIEAVLRRAGARLKASEQAYADENERLKSELADTEKQRLKFETALMLIGGGLADPVGLAKAALAKVAP